MVLKNQVNKQILLKYSTRKETVTNFKLKYYFMSHEFTEHYIMFLRMHITVFTKICLHFYK